MPEPVRVEMLFRPAKYRPVFFLPIVVMMDGV